MVDPASLPITQSNFELPPPRKSLVGQVVSRISASSWFDPAELAEMDSEEEFGSRSNKGSSSLELRRAPVPRLLLPARGMVKGSSSASSAMLREDSEYNNNEQGKQKGFLRRTCLNSKYSIRKQLMLTFGFVYASTILIVMIVCIVISLLCGDVAKRITYESVNNFIMEIESTTARYLAEDLTPQLIPEDLIQILTGAVQERFKGYPDFPGYEEDTLVPFWDTESQTNKYPVVGEPLPLDWQIERNVNDENYMEHVQNRWNWTSQSVSTTTASYYMQGMCDPSVTETTLPTFFPNCSPENNNISSGGIVAPTLTNYLIHRKASDLTPLLKALYEYHQNVITMGVYFANGGSGSTLQFPHYELDASIYYQSIGCDWLMKTANPYDESRPIFADPAWQTQIKDEAICRPSGSNVSSRIYNPMERGWCRDQAINPFKIHVTDAYIDAFNEVTLITVGRAVYDDLTSEFLACVTVDYALDSLSQILQSSLLYPNSEATIVRYDQVGTVVATTALYDMTSMTSMKTIDMIETAGVTKEIYQKLWSLVNYTNYTASNWNETEIREAYEGNVNYDVENGYRVFGYPIPPPPKQYDPYYVPDFMAILAVPTAEMHEGVEKRLDEIDTAVLHFIVVNISVGFAGLGLMAVFIAFVSHYLTRPMRYMNEVATEIFKMNFGDDSYNQGPAGVSDKWVDDGDPSSEIYGHQNQTKKKIHQHKSFKKSRFTPRTELHEVVHQFEKMVSQFAGTSMAKSVQIKERETKNEFSLLNEFQHLYLSRRDDPKEEEEKSSTTTTKFRYEFIRKTAGTASEQRSSLRQTHLGPNIKQQDILGVSRHSSTNTSDTSGNKKNGGLFFYNVKEGKKKKRGGLFFWVVLLMVVPFMLTTGATSGIAIYHANKEFVGVLGDTEALFVFMEKRALDIYVRHRARLISKLMEQPIRDLYVLTRYTGWLLFNAVRREDSFTEVVSNAEACKSFFDEQCQELIQEQTCDCTWNDVRGTCKNYTEVDSRILQKLFFISQSQDTWSNGDRNSTSYPNVSFSPETTAWWDSISSLPGSEEGSNASGYSTTYSRIRVLSALPVSQLLYNKDSQNRIHLASLIGFEADGTYIGYEGCAYPGHETASQFVSRKVNARLRPDICPEGKYGFDPRCRRWYEVGKKQYEENKKHLFVTPPYSQFAEENFVQTCTAVLIDPITGEYIGQAAVDFLVTPLLESLSERGTPLSEGGFPLLIKSSSEFFYEETFLGPRLELINPQPVTNIVFANDPDCGDQVCESRAAFQHVLDEMKSGKTGFREFERKNADGSMENLYIAYAPVMVKFFSPLNYSDFSRGVEVSQNPVYSLALAESEEGLLLDFHRTESALSWRVSIALASIVTTLLVSSLLAIYISYGVASSITKPMLYLLELIKQINRLDCYGNAPEIEMDRRGQSLEVVNVSKTMESLYHVICSANVAFFAGDLDRAYIALKDVLGVYRGLDNKKGISIACNNLGNIMLTMFRAMASSGEVRYSMFTKREIVAKGIEYFHEAIQLGEAAYDNFYEAQGWSPCCLEFMQNLSNRYFNRAIFLLNVKDVHENPKEIEELGFRDLKIAQDMDLEIVDEGSEAGWGVRKKDTQLLVTLTRLRGLILLQEMGYPDDWEVDELLEDAFQTVKTELAKPCSILFEEMNAAGRMQQVETELMRYKLLKGDIITAAKIAIRMLVEDEYLLVEAHIKSLEVLVRYVDSSECELEETRAQAAKCCLKNYQAYLSHMMESNAFSSARDKKAAGKAMQGIGIGIADTVRTSKFEKRESRRGDFTMEAF